MPKAKNIYASRRTWYKQTWGSANARSQRKTRRKSSEKIPKGADAAKTYFAALRRVRQAVFDFSDPVLQAGICERIFRAAKHTEGTVLLCFRVNGKIDKLYLSPLSQC